MHGVFGAAGPIADPFESGLAEDGNYPSIHVARRALRVIFAIKINGDSPTVSGELFSRRKEKHPPKLNKSGSNPWALISLKTFSNLSTKSLWQRK
jgi:hypothetical protein